MLKDESNTIKSANNSSTSTTNTPSTKTPTQTNDLQQSVKDRTLFCVNINEKCTEDILYELFLQAGPIENIVRKADKNGTLICLITYKHIQSCEYAISLFNGIKLFDKELKVKPSDSSSASKQDNQNGSRYSQASSNNNSRAYNNNNNNRLSIDNHYQPKMLSQPTTPQSLMPPPQFQAHLLAQAFSSLSPSFGDFGNHHHQLNRSWSGNLNENDYNSSSRRNSSNFDFNNRGSNNSRRSNDFRNNNDYGRDQSNKQGYHHDQSRSRDRRSDYQNNNSYHNKDRSRSRSPLDNNNRKRNRR